MPGPSSISDESVVSRRKNGKFVSRTRSVQCTRGTRLAEKGGKTILEKRKEEGGVGSSARKARRLRLVGHNLLQVESSEHFGSVKSHCLRKPGRVKRWGSPDFLQINTILPFDRHQIEIRLVKYER